MWMAISVEFGPGIRVRRAQQVEEFLVAQPFAPLHNLIVHHADVRGRSPEAGNPQLQEQGGDFPQSFRNGAVCLTGQDYSFLAVTSQLCGMFAMSVGITGKVQRP